MEDISEGEGRCTNCKRKNTLVNMSIWKRCSRLYIYITLKKDRQYHGNQVIYQCFDGQCHSASKFFHKCLFHFIISDLIIRTTAFIPGIIGNFGIYGVNENGERMIGMWAV